MKKIYAPPPPSILQMQNTIFDLILFRSWLYVRWMNHLRCLAKQKPQTTGLTERNSSHKSSYEIPITTVWKLFIINLLKQPGVLCPLCILWGRLWPSYAASLSDSHVILRNDTFARGDNSCNVKKDNSISHCTCSTIIGRHFETSVVTM